MKSVIVAVFLAVCIGSAATAVIVPAFRSVQTALSTAVQLPQK